MKVHPVVARKRNITLRYDIVSQSNTLTTTTGGRQKKLRRLPHIFAKVLELPFHSDADVSIQETPDSLRFIIQTDDDDEFENNNNIRAHTVEIYPGVTKIVIIRSGGDNNNNVWDYSGAEFELDLWRFRLPESTLPELATAYLAADGELIVTVPKDPHEENHGDAGRLILVQ